MNEENIIDNDENIEDIESEEIDSCKVKTDEESDELSNTNGGFVVLACKLAGLAVLKGIMVPLGETIAKDYIIPWGKTRIKNAAAHRQQSKERRAEKKEAKAEKKAEKDNVVEMKKEVVKEKKTK